MIKTSNLKYIDEGAFGIVYLLSPRRVLKVFHTLNKDKIDTLIKDEIRGSKMKGSLPVLKTVTVLHNDKKVKALVKRRLLHQVSYKEVNKLVKKRQITRLWDDRSDNFMKDSKGNIFRVDTMTCTCKVRATLMETT